MACVRLFRLYNTFRQEHNIPGLLLCAPVNCTISRSFDSWCVSTESTEQYKCFLISEILAAIIRIPVRV